MKFEIEGSCRTEEGYTVWLRIIDDGWESRWAGLGPSFKSAAHDAIKKARKLKNEKSTP